MKTCLLSFSGGVDSVASALLLQEQGWDVTLGHLEWLVEGTSFGQEQTRAAHKLAFELDMPLLTLSCLWFPADSYAKYSWVPVCISTIMHHAGDGCVYPGPMQHRYDAVAFGIDPTWVKGKWVEGLRDYAYQGPILFPTDGLTRWDYEIPQHLLDIAVSCYQGVGEDGICPGCPKCERRL